MALQHHQPKTPSLSWQLTNCKIKPPITLNPTDKMTFPGLCHVTPAFQGLAFGYHQLWCLSAPESASRDFTSTSVDSTLGVWPVENLIDQWAQIPQTCHKQVQSHAVQDLWVVQGSGGIDCSPYPEFQQSCVGRRWQWWMSFLPFFQYVRLQVRWLLHWALVGTRQCWYPWLRSSFHGLFRFHPSSVVGAGQAFEPQRPSRGIALFLESP